jgi:hypothetical protein
VWCRCCSLTRAPAVDKRKVSPKCSGHHHPLPSASRSRSWTAATMLTLAPLSLHRIYGATKGWQQQGGNQAGERLVVPRSGQQRVAEEGLNSWQGRGRAHRSGGGSRNGDWDVGEGAVSAPVVGGSGENG